MAQQSFIDMIKSFPDDLLASIIYIFNKLTSKEKDNTITKPNTNNTSNSQQNTQSVSYTINTLSNINISLRFPALKKDEVLLPYDNSYGSTQVKNDTKTVADYVSLFLTSNKVLSTYPVGSIVFSLFPLQEGGIDIFNY